MVQTESQYICIHQCLLTVLEGKENTSPIREIHDNQGYEGNLVQSNHLKNMIAVKNDFALKSNDAWLYINKIIFDKNQFEVS